MCVRVVERREGGDDLPDGNVERADAERGRDRRNHGAAERGKPGPPRAA
jgi:hypothetical protein